MGDIYKDVYECPLCGGMVCSPGDGPIEDDCEHCNPPLKNEDESYSCGGWEYNYVQRY